MKVGDLAECAIWLTGTESDEALQQWRVDCQYMMAREGGGPVTKLGPVSFEIKRPGEDRVPQVPVDVSGPDVRLLVATAEVLGFHAVETGRSFVSELDRKDLKRLRNITRREYALHNPRSPFLSDQQCDEIIERLGPVAAVNETRRAVNGGLFN